MINEGLFGPSKKQIAQDQADYETELAPHKAKRDQIKSIENKDLSEICPRDVLKLTFTPGGFEEINSINFSNEFVEILAHEKTERARNSISDREYKKDHPNTYMRGKMFDEYDTFKMYYTRYLKRRDAHTLFKEVDNHTLPFSEGGKTIWFTCEDGMPFFSVYFNINPAGRVAMNSDGDD